MKVVITANGKGSRMRGLSPLPKHHLYFGDKRIIDHLLDIFPDAEVIEGKPSNSRRETLEYIRDYKDVLIVDCDVIPFGFNVAEIETDWLFGFHSTKDKYSSIFADEGYVLRASETEKLTAFRCSGLYFVKSVAELLERMKSDSIAEAMIGARTFGERSFIKLGDPEDYYEALGIKPTSFTGNKITFNNNTVIKHCDTGESESMWYSQDELIGMNVPKVVFADSEMIITERIYPTAKPTGEDFIKIIEQLKSRTTSSLCNFHTYLDNLPGYDKPLHLPEHPGTFFHGDLSTHNVLKNSRLWLIDPNYKNVFGSWLTDAGKAYFSFIAYEQNYPEARKIADHFGPDVVKFAVAEGLRVCKYKPEYLSIVNNIYEIHLAYCSGAIAKYHEAY